MVVEKSVVACITERDGLLDTCKEELRRVEREEASSTSVHGPSAESIGELLRLLTRLRTATVKVIEAISRWRSTQYGGLLANPRGGNASLSGRTYGVRLAVSGQRLYKNSPEFVTTLKRMQRGEETSGGRITLVMYLGEYDDEITACNVSTDACMGIEGYLAASPLFTMRQVYDEAVLQEAVRLGTSVANMPKRRIVARPCGRHFSVESVGLPKRQCEVRLLGNAQLRHSDI